jgi:hypothetical protein
VEGSRQCESAGGFRHISADFIRHRGKMNRPQSTPLREQPGAPPRDAKVIDAQFKVVRGKGASRLASVGRWAFAFACAAAIGFLIPPVLVVLQEIAAMVRGD